MIFAKSNPNQSPLIIRWESLFEEDGATPIDGAVGLLHEARLRTNRLGAFSVDSAKHGGFDRHRRLKRQFVRHRASDQPASFEVFTKLQYDLHKALGIALGDAVVVDFDSRSIEAAQRTDCRTMTITDQVNKLTPVNEPSNMVDTHGDILIPSITALIDGMDYFAREAALAREAIETQPVDGSPEWAAGARLAFR